VARLAGLDACPLHGVDLEKAIEVGLVAPCAVVDIEVNLPCSRALVDTRRAAVDDRDREVVALDETAADLRRNIGAESVRIVCDHDADVHLLSEHESLVKRLSPDTIGVR
jgi:hypothetical protein